MKAKLLVLPFPLLSHYVRCAALLQGVAGQYDITFAGGCRAAEQVCAAGFKVFDRVVQFDIGKVLECARAFRFDWLNEEAIEGVLLSQVAAITALQPDLIVSDSAQTARMVSEWTGVPHLALLNGYMSRHYRGVRNVPESHPARRFAAKLPPGVFGRIVSFAEAAVMRVVHRPFKNVRRRYRLPRVGSYLGELEGDWCALVDDEKLFPQRALPANVRIVGPAFHDPLQFREQHAAQRRPVLVVTMGSSGYWEGLAALTDPLFRDFRIRVVGATSGAVTGPHIEGADFLDPAQLYAGAVATLCHGGNGSIYQSLSYGVPVLCRPSMFEQEWNVAAFERAGLVTRLPAHPSAQELRSLIEGCSEGATAERRRAAARRFQLAPSRKRFQQLIAEALRGYGNGVELPRLSGWQRWRRPKEHQRA